jgi:hypothetical protein
VSVWHIPCNKQGKRNGGATEMTKNVTGIRAAIGKIERAGKHIVKTRPNILPQVKANISALEAAASDNADLQALALLSVLMVRVTNSRDDGWVSKVERTLAQAWTYPIDFTVQNEGTIYLLHPHTPAAKEWIEDNLNGDIGHRYVNR